MDDEINLVIPRQALFDFLDMVNRAELKNSLGLITRFGLHDMGFGYAYLTDTLWSPEELPPYEGVQVG